MFMFYTCNLAQTSSVRKKRKKMKDVKFVCMAMCNASFAQCSFNEAKFSRKLPDKLSPI